MIVIIIVIAWVAAAGILEIGTITEMTACTAGVLQQLITSNHEYLPARR